LGIQVTKGQKFLKGFLHLINYGLLFQKKIGITFEKTYSGLPSLVSFVSDLKE